MIVRCKECKTEITSSPKPQGCGCPNQLIVYDDQVSANDLGKVVMVQNHNKDKEQSLSEMISLGKSKDASVKLKD